MEHLTGNEEFTLHGTSAGISIKDYWRWAYSDMLNNTYRGVLAEFLVEKSLSFAPSPEKMRMDWMPYDITSPSGRRIEVKSAAYLQSWTADCYSQILFDIAPKRAWSPETGYSPECIRHSDLYVFCVYTALSRDKSIMDLDLWDFYVLPTSALDRTRPLQKKIGLNSLLTMHPVRTGFAELGNVIETIPL